MAASAPGPAGDVLHHDLASHVLLALPVAFGSSHDDAHKRKKRRTAADTADGARDDDAAAAKEPEMPLYGAFVHVSRVLDGNAWLAKQIESMYAGG